MADLVTTKFIYPPNYTATTGHKRYVINCTCISDGTGEANVIKADRSSIYAPEGGLASKLAVDRIDYTIKGMTVVIAWDCTANETIVVLPPGQDSIDFRSQGGTHPTTPTGGTGDIIFSTSELAEGDTYNITLHLRAKS